MVLTVAILKSSLELTVSVKASTGLSPFRVTHSGAIDTLDGIRQPHTKLRPPGAIATKAREKVRSSLAFEQ